MAKRTDKAVIIDPETKKIVKAIAKQKNWTIRASTRIAIEEFSVNHQIEVKE